MRILILHNRYRPTAPSGENAVVDQEAAALEAAGHQVLVLQRHSADIETWGLARRATLPARVLWSRRSQRILAEELVRFAPDVVHVHNTFPLLTPAVLRTCAEAAIPVVSTLHNYKLACANGELFRNGAPCHDCLGGSSMPALRHGCYRSSPMATAPVLAGTAIHAKAWRELVSAYVFISAAQRERLSPLGFPEERCFVKHNFVADPRSLDEADGNVDVSGEQATRPPVVTFVGRLDAAKGAPQLMAAWDILRTQRPVHPLNLVIAGGGPLTETVRHWAATRSEVSFLGMVDRSEVPALLGSARAAVVPSQWEETFGLVAVEAMAAGTPVLVADSGALPELVREGQDGAMFAPRDTHALAGLLSEVADHGQEWAARGLAARRSYLERFTERTNLDQLLGIYRYAIDHPIRWSAVAPVSQSRRPALLPR